MIYFSGWIENLGVVPLFLFFAFLLAPVFFAFALRILLNCLVFDAMCLPQRFNYLVPAYWLKLILIVKVSLSPAYVFAGSEAIFLAKGEQKTLLTPHLLRYSIGNPEVISVKVEPAAKQILIKGRRMGYTDLQVWEKGKAKRRLQFYVLSKKESLKIAQIGQDIQDLGLEVKALGKKLLIKGRVTQWSHFQRLVQLKQELSKQILLAITLSPKLLRKLLIFLYQDLEAQGFEDFSCKLQQNSFPICHYQSFHQSKKLEKRIWQRFHVRLHWTQKHPYQNYLLTFKIIQVELMDGDHFSLGLNKLNAFISGYLTGGFKELINGNFIHIEQNKLKLSTLAEPQSYTTLETKADISIGLEIPFPILLEDNRQGLEWKTAGLKISYQLQGKGSQLILNYNSEVGSASEGGISRRIQKNKIYLNRYNQFHPLFNVYLLNESQSVSSLPLLSHIPAIGRAFKSSQKSINQKYILGLVKLELAHEH